MNDRPASVDIPVDIARFLAELQRLIDELRENEWIDAATHAILRAKLLELEKLAAHDPMARAGLTFYMQSCEAPW